MSIWCSWPHIGTDPTVMYDEGGGLYEVDIDGKRARGRKPVEQRPERGNVVSYADGFSNHYPDLTGTHERPAVIAVASVPHWCVPGVEEGDYSDDSAAPWLRMEVVAPESLNFWAKDADGNPAIEERAALVILDEEAVRSLRDDLTAWLDRPKAMTPTSPVHAHIDREVSKESTR